MGNVYVRLTEMELQKIHQALSCCAELEAANLMSKIGLLVSQMQPGTTLTLEAIQRDVNCKEGNTV